MSRGSAAQPDANRHENQQCSEFHCDNECLCRHAPARHEPVENGCDCHHADCNGVLGHACGRHQVGFERARCEGDCAGESRQHGDPACEESRQRVDVSGEVDVFAAGFNHLARDQAVTDRADEGDHSAQDPDQENAIRRAEIRQCKAGSREYSGADH